MTLRYSESPLFAIHVHTLNAVLQCKYRILFCMETVAVAVGKD